MKKAPWGTLAEPLARHTSLHIGGPAEYYLRVTSERDLVETIRVAREKELPVFMLGAGTNLLVADLGIKGVVLHNDWSETTVDGTVDLIVLVAGNVAVAVTFSLTVR